MMISARNQIDVTISEIQKGAVNAQLLLETVHGMQMSATITNGSVEGMALKPGDRVVAFFKASHVLIATGWAMNISARNRMEGVAESVNHGSVNTEVIVALPGGDRLSSIITNEAAKDLALKSGSDVVAIIKATDVMIAK